MFRSLAAARRHSQPWHRAAIQHPLTLLALAVGLVGGGATAAGAQVEPSPLADGQYLYGEAQTADEPGTTYVVMAVEDGRAVGAFYQPHSSFDCFHGQVGENLLALTIINSYDQTAYAYGMPLDNSRSAIASQGGGASQPTLEGFYAIDTLSDIDHEILATCRAAIAP